MDKKQAAGSGSANGIRKLISVFFGWKLMLLVIACASPGPGYDTSTQILFRQYGPEPDTWLGRAIEHAALRLTRWDGIYFSTLSERGHVNEQEWAFSWVLARFTSIVARVLMSPLSVPAVVKHALSGTIISHLSHLLAVLVLYRLTYELVPATDSTKRKIALTAASLHVLSPAGLFLSAPFGESTFAFANFLGLLYYVLACKADRVSSANAASSRALWTVLAGVCIGIATTIRSNGLLSGMIFAWDAAEELLHPSDLVESSRSLGRFAATVLAGVFVAVGFAMPQLVAYTEYCTSGNTRPWCSRLPPSIYSWVQEQYWKVGFLKYWTVNNLPLFLLATPMLAVLLFTGYIALQKMDASAAACRDSGAAADTEKKPFARILPRFALPQIVLAIMAATSFHVQIVNRISSGYPVWYIVLAIAIHASSKTVTRSLVNPGSGAEPSENSAASASKTPKSSLSLSAKQLQWIVRGMVIYAIVQGGLYASFLPPA